MPDLSKLFIAQSTFDEYVSRLVAVDQTIGRSGTGKEPGEFGAVGGCELRQSRSGGVCRERLGRGLGDGWWFGTLVKCGERTGCIVSYGLARYRLTLCKQCFFDIRGAALLEPANQPGSLVPSVPCEEAVVVGISDGPYLAKRSCGEVRGCKEGVCVLAGEDAGLKESERAGSVRTHVVLVYEGEQLVVVLRLLWGWGVSAGRAGGDLQYAEAILEQWGEKLYKAQQRYIARGMRRHRRFSN